MKINMSKQTFTGYSNILANEYGYGYDKTSMINLRLDNIGTNDLDQFISLKKMAVSESKSPQSDILTIFEQGSKNRDYIFLDRQVLFSGEELELLSAEASVLPEKLQDYTLKEKFYIKAYTFLASLTKRMMNDNTGTKRDMEFYRVLHHSQNNLTYILDDKSTANMLLRDALIDETVPFQSVAKNINDSIVKTMRYFFR